MKKNSGVNTSLAGEFAVLSQLALRGYDANMTLGNTKGVDILMSDPKTEKMFRIEVKTCIRTAKNRSYHSKIFGYVFCDWIMDMKHENITDEKLFYCFVNILEETGEFGFYIVPSKVVAKYIEDEHSLWCKARKRSKKQADNSMRLFRIGKRGEKYSIDTPLVENYENNWEFNNKIKSEEK